MGIFKRISDIISANFNDMVEGYEDPEDAEAGHPGDGGGDQHREA